MFISTLEYHELLTFSFLKHSALHFGIVFMLSTNTMGSNRPNSLKILSSFPKIHLKRPKVGYWMSPRMSWRSTLEVLIVIPVGMCPCLIHPTEPTAPFDLSEPKLCSLQKFLKKTRSSSSPGTMGYPIKYTKCHSDQCPY